MIQKIPMLERLKKIRRGLSFLVVFLSSSAVRDERRPRRGETYSGWEGLSLVVCEKQEFHNPWVCFLIGEAAKRNWTF